MVRAITCSRVYPVFGKWLRLKRRYWFDRFEQVRLARLETFDDHGVLETEVKYSDERSVGNESPWFCPRTSSSPGARIRTGSI